LKKYLSLKNGVFISTIIPAIIFGLFHLINLTQNDDVLAVLIQVVFATFIGFFFGALVLKTNKILPIAVTHGLVNFFFSLTFLPSLNVVEETDASFAPIILALPLFIIGLLVVKKIRKKDIIKKLN
jgi:membrane protease YdiL (CAAX protease family)